VVKRPLGRPRRRREDSIKIVLQEVGWGIYWIDLAHNTFGLHKMWGIP